ncbi:hypothetical protein ABWI13_30850 [Streptomyces koyangensis]|uniref:hypothetical protein n=1 Tax=Streptomyces TaxID=1883 RepID=UPI00338B4849
MTTTHRSLAVLVLLLPVILVRLRLVAVMAGGAWLVGIDLGPLARIGLFLVAVAAVVLDVLLDPADRLQAVIPTQPTAADRDFAARGGAR